MLVDSRPERQAVLGPALREEGIDMVVCVTPDEDLLGAVLRHEPEVVLIARRASLWISRDCPSRTRSELVGSANLIPNWLKRSAHAGAGNGLEKTRLTLGFIPLTDCAPLVVAKEEGYFEKHGLQVELSKETSWSNVRDKVSIGILDGAQMLAPMPIASTFAVVLGVNQEWAEQNPNTHYVNAPPEIVGMSMTGTFRYGLEEAPVSMPDFNAFFRFAATFPWRSHAEWFLTQMVRWGRIKEPVDIAAVADEVYRPDLYREAAEALGLAVPMVDRKIEGLHARGWTLEQATEPLAMGPDRLFDGRGFDPADLDGYLAGFDVQHGCVARG